MDSQAQGTSSTSWTEKTEEEEMSQQRKTLVLKSLDLYYSSSPPLSDLVNIHDTWEKRVTLLCVRQVCKMFLNLNSFSFNFLQWTVEKVKLLLLNMPTYSSVYMVWYIQKTKISTHKLSRRSPNMPLSTQYQVVLLGHLTIFSLSGMH